MIKTHLSLKKYEKKPSQRLTSNFVEYNLELIYQSILLTNTEIFDRFTRKDITSINNIFQAAKQAIFGKIIARDKIHKTAYIFYEIIKQHPPKNGNKRTAVGLCFQLLLSYFTIPQEKLLFKVISYLALLTVNISSSDRSEVLKILYKILRRLVWLSNNNQRKTNQVSIVNTQTNKLLEQLYILSKKN